MPFRRSVRGKLLAVVIATTTVALLMTGAAMTLYDVRSFRERQLAELTAQADILGLATGAALQFADPPSALDRDGRRRLRPGALRVTRVARHRGTCTP